MSVDDFASSPPAADHPPAVLYDRVRVWFMVLGLVGLTLVVAGCESPLDYFQQNPPGVEGEQAGEAPANEQEKEGADAEADGQEDTAAEEAPDVEVHGLEPGTEAAREMLEDNFSDFLERRPLGFDHHFFVDIAEDARHVGEEVYRVPGQMQEFDLEDVAFDLLAPLVVALFLIAFALLDRAWLRWARRLRAELHVDLSSAATRALRALVLLVGRLAPFLILVLVSYFPVQAVADQSMPSQFLSAALWLGVGYRVAQTVWIIAFNSGIIDIPRADARRLQTFCRWATNILFAFFLALIAINVFEYREEAYRFVLFALQVTTAVLLSYLFFARDSVLALLPDMRESRLYSVFYRVIAGNFRWLLAITIALLLLRAAGYVNATTFLLVRGYAILLLLLVAFVLGRWAVRFLERRTEEIDAAARLEEQTGSSKAPQLTRSLQQLLLLAGGLIVVVIVLDLLALREPVVALLKTPLFGVGQVQLSLFNVLVITLIVFGTVLTIKIVKALLNARVYPALSVDVGVAYAINTLLTYVLIVVAFLMGLAAMGVNLSAIAVVLASLGVGIGFGLQTLTENLISGFILLFGRSVKKGDFISVNDTYGKVEAVGARSVVIRTPDNFDMLIPSKEIVGGQITNWTFRDSLVRARIDVGAAYDCEPHAVKEVLLDAADRFEYVLEKPEPEVWLVGFGDNSVGFQLLLYFDCREISPARFKGLIYFEIWDAMHEAEISIPYPQRDLHIRTADILPEIREMVEGTGSNEAESSADPVSDKPDQPAAETNARKEKADSSGAG